MTGIKNAKRVVFKVGTSSLTYPTGKTNIRRLAKLVSILSDLQNEGREIVLVSSGAISVGAGKLGLKERPQTTPARQAAACIGQCELMFMYDKFFSEYSHVIGQLLVTKSDVEDEERRNNLINAFNNMFEFGAIPIVNENDSVAVEEIVYGDNDSLSATVACLIDADALIILTDADGLFSGDPQLAPDARLSSGVAELTPEIKALAGGAVTKQGTGGMITKLNAAEIATSAGIDTVIMSGSDPREIYKLFDGHHIGTYFKGKKRNDNE